MNLLDRISAACSESNSEIISAETELTSTFDSLQKVMPPTYIYDGVPNKWTGRNGKNQYTYHIENRYLDGQPVEVVVLDSAPSAANRLEEAAYQAYLDGEFPQPVVRMHVDVQEDCRENYSTLQLSHRIFSGFFKHTNLDGVNFLKTAWGEKLYHNDHKIVAKAVLQVNPLAILLGTWRSHVKDVKLNRARAYRKAKCLVMQIIGGEPITNLKSGGMISPMSEEHMDTTRNSERGLGIVPPSLSLGGVSVKWIRERFYVSIGSLFDFHTGDKKHDSAARTMLVCMGLYAHVLRQQNYYLRSECVLRRKNAKEQTKYVWNGDENDFFSLTAEEAKKLYLDSAAKVPDFEIDLKLELEADEFLTTKWQNSFMTEEEVDQRKEAAAAKKKKSKKSEETEE